MKISKKISALLCSVAMCCFNGQVSKTSASLLGYFFSVAAAQQWVFTALFYYARFKSSGDPKFANSWFLPFLKPSDNINGNGFIRVAKSLSRLDNLAFPVVLTYLAREEFRKEKENNKRVSDKNMHVDQKNDKGKKDSNNKK